MLIIVIIWFILITKSLLFWTWLWQLKEYHWGRFNAHFETLWFRKFASSYYRIKIPKFTNKVIILLSLGVILELVFVWFFNDYIHLICSFIAAPIVFSVIILLLQIPVVIIRKRIMKKAEKKRQGFKELLVIGITGSYGKTSTKELLYDLLSKKYNVLKTKEHINSEIGIAQTILNDLNKKHEIFIVEIGAYNKGKIREVCSMVKPSIGVITGINEQHMSTFGSLENIISGKYELIESLPAEGLAVFNGFNKHCVKMFQRTSIHKRMTQPNDVSEKHNMENMILASLIAKELGVSSKALKPVALKKKGKIIDATYSANVHGVLSHLDYLDTYSGKKILIMPCLIELGKSSSAIHRKIGERIDRVCDLAIITTKDRFKELKGRSDKIIYMHDPKKIYDKIKAFSYDILLLESRVPAKLKSWLLNK